jgi:hypothetical protein
MCIGQHFLEGSVVALKLPFLVVEKKISDQDGSALDVEGFVLKKILFKQRPKPIGVRKN